MDGFRVSQQASRPPERKQPRIKDSSSLNGRSRRRAKTLPVKLPTDETGERAERETITTALKGERSLHMMRNSISRERGKEEQ